MADKRTNWPMPMIKLDAKASERPLPLLRPVRDYGRGRPLLRRLRPTPTAISINATELGEFGALADSPITSANKESNAHK